jgi:ribosome-associated toxin RatA of RatAB toxin-antitoxin module
MDSVLEVVQDFRKYHRILPRLELSRVVGKKKGMTDVYMRAPILRGLAHVWGIARFTPPKRYKRHGRAIAARMVDGNLDGWHGVWRLYPCGKRTVLRMEMFIDLQIPVPDAVVTPELEWAADKAVTAVRDMVECGHSSVKGD